MPAPDRPPLAAVPGCELPPLILHPFADQAGAASLLETSRAAFMLAGGLPAEGLDQEQLIRRVLQGRFLEVRMLFFVGKDLFRWMEQCVGSIEHRPELTSAGLSERSFAHLLIHETPETVRSKLIGWGVGGYATIFSRAIGLKAIFRVVPEFQQLSDDFVRHYHHYSDRLYDCWLHAQDFATTDSDQFPFQLYASAEYSRLLESQWTK